MLKIIIIIIGYILNNFNYSHHNIIIDGGKYIYIFILFLFFQILKGIYFLKKKIIHFVIVKTDHRLW
jgi:hypothetical protein